MVETTQQKNVAGRSKPFIVAFSVALILFALVNMAVGTYLTAHPTKITEEIFQQSKEQAGATKPWSWWLARNYLEQTQAPDLVPASWIALMK